MTEEVSSDGRKSWWSKEQLFLHFCLWVFKICLKHPFFGNKASSQSGVSKHCSYSYCAISLITLCSKVDSVLSKDGNGGSTTTSLPTPSTGHPALGQNSVYSGKPQKNTVSLIQSEQRRAQHSQSANLGWLGSLRVLGHLPLSSLSVT